MINILLTGSLRSPPYPASRDSNPIQGGGINRSTLTLGIMWHNAEHP